MKLIKGIIGYIYDILMIIAIATMAIGIFMPVFYIPIFEEGATLIQLKELINELSWGFVPGWLGLAVLAVIVVLLFSAICAFALYKSDADKAIAVPSGIVALIMLGIIALTFTTGVFGAYIVIFDAGYYMMLAGAVVSAVLPFTPLAKHKKLFRDEEQ